MKKILVTGGTVFVSRYIAEYFVKKGDQVYVLNRGNHIQPKHTILIQGDRHKLGDLLKNYELDVVLDVTAYTGKDIECLLEALGSYKAYILISSSAVYPETEKQPFKENSRVGENKYWGLYGTNKIEAEKVLLERVPSAYVLRPPYLYGPMNNVYREAFVFDCAMKGRKFFLPREGEMKLQFFYIHDLCKIIESVLEKKPNQPIFNVGNEIALSIKEWVEMCYAIVGKKPTFEKVMDHIEQRQYFSFYDYEYILDVSAQKELLVALTPLQKGLEESYDWYKEHMTQVNKKDYIKFIDSNIR